MTRDEREEKVTRLCDEHGCSPKKRKVHFDQFVDRNWHPHPPQRFLKWFAGHADKKESPDLNPVVAFNCASYYDSYCEAKETAQA